MNILCTYALRSLKKNKVRTLVTIVGIILSVSMFTAVTSLVSSMHSFLVDIITESDGDWHVAGLSLSGEKAESLKQDGEVAAAYGLENLGYAKLEHSANRDKPYLFVAGMQEGFADGMPVRLTSGRMPQNGTEILLPDHLASNGGVRCALGEKLTLELGERTLLGERLTQQNSFFGGGEDEPAETWTARESRTFTVVGTFTRPGFEPFTAAGYTALTVATGEGESVDLYIKLKDMFSAEAFIRRALSGEQVDVHSDLLRLYGASGEVGFNRVLNSLAGILAAIIFVASISLICNAFSISVSERTKQFGLLSSIGATKKQLRASVMFEAATLSLIGIPLGVGAGLLGIGVTLRLLWPSFATLIGTGVSATLHLQPSFGALAIAAGLGLATVLISAWIPARRATKMPAIDAIRQTADINIKGRDVKTSKLTYRLFGFPGMIARKNFKRSRRKYRATVFSLFVSVVLFISASSFCAYLKMGVEDVVNVRDYELQYYLYGETELSPEVLLRRFSAVEGVQQASFFADKDVMVRINADAMAEDYRARLHRGEDADAFDDVVRVLYVDEASYRSLAAQAGVSGQAGQGLLYNERKIYDYEEDRFHLLPVLKGTSGVLDAEEEGAQYPYAALVTSGPLGTGAYAAPMVIYPYAAAGEEVRPMDVVFYFHAQDHKKAEENLRKALEALSLPVERLVNYAESTDTSKALVTVINVFSYGFIVLISLIAAANVFNTISTNIGLRRREFAMLRSVGMTEREFSRMMRFECWMYGAKGLMFGLPAAAAVTYLIFRGVSEGYAARFFLPWQSVAIAVGSVFAVVFSTMVYATRKLKGENTADALKNENL